MNTAQRKEIAETANLKFGRSIVLSAESSREELIAWIVSSGDTGCAWTDEDCIAQGGWPMDLEDAWEVVDGFNKYAP